MFGLSPLLWAGGVGALVGGATGSLHCALMCGPLACATLPAGGGRRRAALAWHGGRLLAYTTLGGWLGALGQGVAAALALRVEPVLPWLMAAGLVASALEVGRRLPAIPGLSRLPRAAARVAAGLEPATRAALFGAATPFLPCGLLYGMFLAAVATGSGPGGALVMLLFALGGVPALAGAQASTSLGARFPATARVLRRAVPLVAAAVLVWRALAVGGAEAPPACH